MGEGGGGGATGGAVMAGILTCAALSHSLFGSKSGPHCGDHHLVQSSWFQFLEDNMAGVHSNTLILDDTAIMDQQNLIPV